MTITVGTDTYLSLSDANAYWSKRNNSVWSDASDADKEKALIEATQYLDGAYSFIGRLNSVTQPLAWPRVGAIVTSGNFKDRLIQSDEIPSQLKDATAELALEALSARLDAAQENVISKVKVDVIEVEYADFAPSKKSFSFVTRLLNGLIIGGSNSVKLARV